MNRFILIPFLSLFIQNGSLPQLTHVARQQLTESEPTVEVLFPRYVYKQTMKSLRTVDFRNFQIHVFDARKSILIAKLRNGKYESNWASAHGSDWLRLNSVDFLGNHSEFGVVSLSWVTTGASASAFGLVQVFTLREGHPVVVQQILFNARGCGTSASIRKNVGGLTVRGVHGWEHCCPNTLDVLTFSWTGSSFERKTQQSVSLPTAC